MTFTFSEAPSQASREADISGFGRSRAGWRARWPGRVNPLLWTATVTAADGFDGTGTVTVATGLLTDAAGNAGIGGTRHRRHRHREPDGYGRHRRRSLSDTTTARGHLHLQRGAGQLQRSRHLGFGRSVAGGGLAGQDAVNPLLWTATVTANDGFDGTGTVTVGTAWQDAVGNAGIGGNDTVAIDRVNPTVTVDIAVPDSRPRRPVSR